MVVYLDNAATTRPLAEVVEEMSEVALTSYGNASSPHALGRQSKAIVERARAVVAESLAVAPEEIYFTSGGTEANNLALRGYMMAVDAGVVGAAAASPRAQSLAGGVAVVAADEAALVANEAALAADEAALVVPAVPAAPEIVTSELEHPSVTRTLRDLKQAGHAVSYTPAVHGRFDMDAFRGALSSATKLISLMWVQNVFGYLFPLEECARLRDTYAPQAVFHSDAVQAFGCYTLRPKELGLDMLSISAHKIGGPKGIGALYVRGGLKMFTTAFGGGQERGLRSGTEAVPLIAGFAKAVELLGGESGVAANMTRMRDVRQHLMQGLKERFSDVVINSREGDGGGEGDRDGGSPAIAHFSLPNIDNKKAVEFLSERGIYIGISTACDSAHIRKGEAMRKKHPLVARLAGLSKAEEKGAFRASFCASTSIADADALLEALWEYSHSVGAK